VTLALPAATASGRAPSPPVFVAAAASLLVHALLAGVVLLSGGGSPTPVSEAPFAGVPLQARLAGARPVASPSPAPTVSVTPESVAPTPARQVPEAVIPLPRPAALPAPPRNAPPTDRTAVLPDDGAPVDPSVEAAIAATHPGLARVTVEFEVEPAPRYPERARGTLRQVLLRVPVIVAEDGTLRIAEGTFDDPTFGRAIAEALASARAQAPQDGAAPSPGWTVLTFYFEHYGAGESQRTLHEAK
jgi:hypothetical protein